jgi:hypothetical protein
MYSKYDIMTKVELYTLIDSLVLTGKKLHFEIAIKLQNRLKQRELENPEWFKEWISEKLPSSYYDNASEFIRDGLIKSGKIECHTSEQIECHTINT